MAGLTGHYLTMKIKVTSSTLMNGQWHEPGIGNYDPVIAQHLISIGSAVLVDEKMEKTKIENKMDTPEEHKKKENQYSYSQQGLASTKKTAKKSKDKK